MCRACYERKSIRDCPNVCGCRHCNEDTQLLCTDWLWEPPAVKADLDPQQVLDFSQMLQNVRIA